MTSTTLTMTANDVAAAIERFHGCDTGTGEWVCLPEALARTAGGGIDVLAVGVWQTASVPGLPGCGTRPACGPCFGLAGRNVDCDTCRGTGARYDASYPMVAWEIKISRS